MFMLLLSGNRYNPDTFINVKQVYGTTLASRGQSVPVKVLFGDVISDGNTLSIPLKAVCGTTLDNGADLQKPVKSIYGYLLVTEV
ncbi:hypothetical protein DRK59_01565 [Salmonella enterica subsp. diarizonae]|uniref:hypothetical protein n=1 Tax=Salmonella enterica TaxID=28901 RepID=UPI000F988792|nr:hypothetical protein [Salmonella enterica]ECE0107107.1 hypothetical protein [Salmonella enterica subsp. diarizonae]EAQ6114222.1 hypothetical protein [Salmonella enterica]ECC6249601.1 hypothetical protein [Salmonella enterica]ECF6070276.1 hypothetical protein [Salmonella enterica subsp. diarizonae]